MSEQILPEYLSWFGIEQILWLCSKAMNFIYNIAPNVGLAVILYAVFSHLLFLPFSIKNGIDRRKGEKINKKLTLLNEEFLSLSEEGREKEEVKKSFRERKKEIQKGKGSTGVGCLIIILRLFVLISAMPVISYIEHFVNPAEEAFFFFGFNLNDVPLENFSLSIIFPIFTAFLLTLSGILSTRRNLKMQKEIKEKKTKEEREEEERMLKEMGIKEQKIPMGYIIQIAFGLLYVYTFSRIKISLSLYWCAYYIIGFGVKALINFIFSKIPDRKEKEIVIDASKKVEA